MITLRGLQFGARDILAKTSPIQPKSKWDIFVKILKYTFFVFIFLLLVAGVITGLNYKAIKDISGILLAGKGDIDSATALLQNGDFAAGKERSISATGNFQEATTKINSLQSKLFFLKNDLSSTAYLTTTAKILADSMTQISGLGIEMEKSLSNKNKNFTQLSRTDKQRFLDFLYRSQPEVSGLKSNIDLSLMYIDKVNYFGLIFFAKDKIADLKNKLVDTQVTLTRVLPLMEIMPIMAGYPDQSQFLILLQNNDELRPTGGFIGTYGIMQTDSGDILRLDTHDVYHLDMPVRDKVTTKPPKPLADYLGMKKWFFRDVNWFPDFPASAKKAESFFYREDKLLPEKDQVNHLDGQFDGVIAITPKVITDMLTFIGPVTIDGVEYNQKNFTDLLQYKVEKGYELEGTPSWQRKEEIGKILAELKIRVFNLGSRDLFKASEILFKNIEEKNALVYFNDPQFQRTAVEQNWAGELKQTASDYLMIVDANLAAFKSDRVIDRNVNYQLTEIGDDLRVKVNASYAHNGGFDWKTTKYRSYTRFYVPLGSRFINASGYESDKVDIYNESSKTVFGMFHTVEPKQIGAIEIEYKLPTELVRKIKEQDSYELYIQKQPGKITQSLSVSLNLESKKINKKNKISWDSDLDVDRAFSAKLTDK